MSAPASCAASDSNTVAEEYSFTMRPRHAFPAACTSSVQHATSVGVGWSTSFGVQTPLVGAPVDVGLSVGDEVGLDVGVDVAVGAPFCTGVACVFPHPKSDPAKATFA